MVIEFGLADSDSTCNLIFTFIFAEQVKFAPCACSYHDKAPPSQCKS